MNRFEFLRLVSISSFTTLLPLSEIDFSSEKYSEADLIGKGSPKLCGNGFLLQEKAATAFEAMQAAAKKEGIGLIGVSSYRSYAHQNRIWKKKYKRYTARGLSPVDSIQKIITYSTIPGTSRHHWGTDIDIIDTAVPQPKYVLQPRHFQEDGAYARLKKWTDEHAKEFGFELVYTDNPNRKGFHPEPWHFSFSEISVPMLKAYKKLDVLRLLQSQQLLGSDHFSEEFIQQYLSENILDINPQLLPG